jgi:hypothetical protein
MGGKVVAQAPPILSDTLIANQTKYGYKSDGHFSIPPVFIEAHPFTGGFALVREKDYYTYINKRGDILSHQQFVEAKDFSEGLAAVKMSGGWGFVNSHIHTVISPQYLQVLSFSEGAAAVKKSKWRFVNKKNESLFEEESDTVVANFSNGAAIVGVWKNGWHYGLMSSKGKWVVTPQYISVKLLATGLFSAKNEQGDFEVIDSQGKNLLQGLEYVRSINDTAFLFEKEGRKNLFNQHGELQFKIGFKGLSKENKAIPFPNWKMVDTSQKELYTADADSFSLVGNVIVRHLNDKKQVIWPTTLPFWYQEIHSFSPDVYRVKQKDKWGLVNGKGTQKCPILFDTLFPFGTGVKVVINGKMGLLDAGWNTTLTPIYTWMVPSSYSPRLFFKRADTCGFFYLTNLKEQAVLSYDSLSDLGTEFLLGWKGKKAFLLNDSLRQLSNYPFLGGRRPLDTIVVLFDQDSVYRLDLCLGRTTVKGFQIKGWVNDTLAWAKTDTTKGIFHLSSDSLYVVDADTIWPYPDLASRLFTRKGDTLGLAHITGKWQTSYNRNYRYIGRLDHDYIKVMARKRFGFADSSGVLRIATQYDSVGRPSEQFFAVKVKTKWGVVNRKERFVIHPNYSKAGVMYQGKIAMWTGPLAMLVDDKGQELFNPRFHDIQPSQLGYWITRKGTNYGFLNLEAKEVLTPRFEMVQEIPLGYFIVRHYGKTGILNRNFQESWPLKEKEIKWIKGTSYFAIRVE